MKYLQFNQEDSMLLDSPECPACGSSRSEPLGALGSLFWHRCRACGIDFHTENENAQEPDQIEDSNHEEE